MSRNLSTTKTCAIVLLCLCGFLQALEATLNECPLDSTVAVEGKKNLWKSGCFYFSGQPTLETLRWLKSEGVTIVINLRAENENRDFTDNSFNEENVVKELGMSYFSLPVGDKATYSPATVDKFAEILKTNTGKALVHCLSGGRVTFVWIAYLVRHRNYSLNDAIEIGKKIKYAFPLEDFLGSQIQMSIEKK
jgi:protein tyrosine phosphatase (PTP) superfamily phosphohydrolase (DUF442 family)